MGSSMDYSDDSRSRSRSRRYKSRSRTPPKYKSSRRSDDRTSRKIKQEVNYSSSKNARSSSRDKRYSSSSRRVESRSRGSRGSMSSSRRKSRNSRSETSRSGRSGRDKYSSKSTSRTGDRSRSRAERNYDKKSRSRSRSPSQKRGRKTERISRRSRTKSKSDRSDSHSVARSESTSRSRSVKRSESDSSRSRSRSKSKSGRSRSRSNSMDSRSNSRSNSRSASGSPDRVVERASSSKDAKKEKDRKDRKRKEARSRHKSGSNSKSTTAIVNSGPPHQVGKLFPNIYERPIGPRTGIGYPEADVIEIRFLVPSKISGSIIGKKGDYVQKLRKDFQIGVGIPDSPNNYLERVCVIRGASVRNVIDCCCAIADYPLKKEMNAGLKIEKHHTQIRLLMHQSVCGAIIGKKASQILEIRNMSGADVQVCSYNCPGTTDRVVKVTGSITEIRDALALIFKFTGDQNVKGVENNYLAILPDPENNEDPGQYFGWTDDEVELMGADVDTRKRGTMAARKIVEVELDRHGKPRMDNLTENSRAKLNGMPPQKQYAKFGPKKDYFDSSNTTGQQYQGENSAKLKNIYDKTAASYNQYYNQGYGNSYYNQGYDNSYNQGYNQSGYYNQGYNNSYHGGYGEASGHARANKTNQPPFSTQTGYTPGARGRGRGRGGSYGAGRGGYHHSQGYDQSGYDAGYNSQAYGAQPYHAATTQAAAAAAYTEGYNAAAAAAGHQYYNQQAAAQQSNRNHSSTDSSSTNSSSDSDDNERRKRKKKKKLKHIKIRNTNYTEVDKFVGSSYAGMRKIKNEYTAATGYGNPGQINVPYEAKALYSKAKRSKKMNEYDTPDAPAYEGPNTMGPNRADYKREHPLTALDLQRQKAKKR